MPTAGQRRPSLRTTDQRNALVVANMALIHRIVGDFLGTLPPFARIAYRYEDAKQDALLGLIRAAELWEVEKGAFSTYAYRWMYQSLSTSQLRNRVVRVPRHVWEEEGEVPSTFSGCDHHWFDQHPNHRGNTCEGTSKETEAAEEAVVRVRSALEKVSDRYRGLIESRLAGKTFQEIAKLEGVSREAIRQRQVRAWRELRRHLEDVG